MEIDGDQPRGAVAGATPDRPGKTTSRSCDTAPALSRRSTNRTHELEETCRRGMVEKRSKSDFVGEEVSSRCDDRRKDSSVRRIHIAEARLKRTAELLSCKVRENYELATARDLIASDRISAFDVKLASFR